MDTFVSNSPSCLYVSWNSLSKLFINDATQLAEVEIQLSVLITLTFLVLFFPIFCKEFFFLEKCSKEQAEPKKLMKHVDAFFIDFNYFMKTIIVELTKPLKSFIK